MRHTDPAARFEAVADLYYRRTGNLRPGKSWPLSMPEPSDNREQFDAYMATHCFGDALDRIVQLEAEAERRQSLIEDLEEQLRSAIEQATKEPT
jgi:hypothetical protein